MGREVRRVPANWEHPRDKSGSYVPLHEGRGYTSSAQGWDEERAKWDRGEFPTYADAETRALSYAEWAGERPDAGDYMPHWPEAERTHYQMYETTTEGTPISPVMATPENLARWLADNGASSFGQMTATYEQWLSVCRGGWAPSLVLSDGVLESGVAAISDRTDQR